MNVVYAFIGKLPSYSIDTVHQTRLFFSGPIYFITSEPDCETAKLLHTKYSVHIVSYDDVIHVAFNSLVASHSHRFCIMEALKDREKIFIYSFERFFILRNLMEKYNLQDVFFMEVDNLIYDTPEIWLPNFSRKEMGYMFDNTNRGASGICYIKNISVLDKFCMFCMTYIMFHQGFLEEMGALYEFWTQHKDLIHYFPTHWSDSTKPQEVQEWYSDYGSVFDAASIGIFLGGMDPFHTNGKVVKGLKGGWSMIDYTGYSFKWESDSSGRNIPYIYTGSDWVRINNLHVHSKELTPLLSKPIESRE
jgi:hypothetical protein